MSKVIVLGLAGETQLYVADVAAGTIVPLDDSDGRAGALRSAGAPVARGVDFAVALSPADPVFSGLFD